MALQIITPPPTTTIAAAPTVAAANLSPVNVAVVSTPANIEQLLRQITISGTLTAAPDATSVTLATTLGNFTFSFAQAPEAAQQQLNQSLLSLFQNQKPVTAIIQAGSPPSQAVLLLPNQTTATSNTTIPAAIQQPTLSQPVTLSVGSTFPAVVLPPDIVVPNATTPTPTQTAPATQTSVSNPNTLQTTDKTVLQPNALLQSGKEILLHIDAVFLPSSPPLMPNTQNQMTANVIGNGSNGQLILKAGDATLYIRSPVDAPIGTNLLITVDAPKSATPAILPPVQEQNFDSLQQTLDALTQINPQLAQQFIDTHVPQANAQISAPLMFLLHALKQGDAKSWLGKETTETLTKAGKLSLLSKLAHDMNTSTQTAHDPVVGEWKTYPIPMLSNSQFQAVTLSVHADSKQSSPDNTEGNTPNRVRFLIDVRMSHLGPIQLDGLVRPQKLDMIVRSESQLPPGLPQDLRNAYITTLEAHGFTGSLSFQLGKQNWIEPRKETHQSVVL